MAEVRTYAPGIPIWVDLASADIEGSKRFYSGLFGWTAAVSPQPEAGGYTMLRLGDKDAAGLGPTQSAGQPSAWMVYIGTDDADATTRKVEAAGGKVVTSPFAVMDAGRMAVFQDPANAVIAVWQPMTMPGAGVMNQPNSLGWCELNSRDLDRVRDFYRQVFGWGEKMTPMGEGQGSYIEWQVDGRSVAGAMAMSTQVPADVPSFWMVYFNAEDLDGVVDKARSLGAQVRMAPTPYPGGRFAVLQDPQGAVFGLLSS